MIQGERLRRLRESMGLTQAEVAARLSAAGAGVNQAFLSQVERGGKNVSLETLAALAGLYAVSTDYLLGISNEMASRENGEECAVLSESDPVLRSGLQQMFDGVERLPEDLRRQFYDAMQLVYLGIMHKRRERSR
jgi:transcriptional regulator with XRE-family HTH domain